MAISFSPSEGDAEDRPALLREHLPEGADLSARAVNIDSAGRIDQKEDARARRHPAASPATFR